MIRSPSQRWRSSPRWLRRSAVIAGSVTAILGAVAAAKPYVPFAFTADVAVVAEIACESRLDQLREKLVTAEAIKNRAEDRGDRSTAEAMTVEIHSLRGEIERVKRRCERWA